MQGAEDWGGENFPPQSRKGGGRLYGGETKNDPFPEKKVLETREYDQGLQRMQNKFSYVTVFLRKVTHSRKVNKPIRIF